MKTTNLTSNSSILMQKVRILKQNRRFCNEIRRFDQFRRAIISKFDEFEIKFDELFNDGGDLLVKTTILTSNSTNSACKSGILLAVRQLFLQYRQVWFYFPGGCL